MKTKLLAVAFLAGTSLFARDRVYLGFGIGGYYPPPPAPIVTYYARPPAPGPNFVWVAGYWYPAGSRWALRAGYWVPRPYPQAVWVGPRYVRGHWSRGYWR
jgi:hypothetical protein